MDLAGLLMLLGFVLAIGFIVVGQIVYFTSDRDTGRRILATGGGIAVLAIIFVAVCAVFMAANQPQQNQATWNLLRLLLSVAVTWFVFRMFWRKT